MDKVWVVTTHNDCDFVDETRVKVFKNEKDARDFYKRQIDLDYNELITGRISVYVNPEADAQLVEGEYVIYITKDSYESYIVGEYSGTSWTCQIEEQEVL